MSKLSLLPKANPFYEFEFGKTYISDLFISDLGSFYDNSKIENPNEFDLNIVLDLNGLGISYEIVRLDGCPPGYIMIQVHTARF